MVEDVVEDMDMIMSTNAAEDMDMTMSMNAVVELVTVVDANIKKR